MSSLSIRYHKLYMHFIPPPISSICPAVVSLMIPTKLSGTVNFKNRFIRRIDEQKWRIQNIRKCNLQVLVSKFECLFFKSYLYLLEKKLCSNTYVDQVSRIALVIMCPMRTVRLYVVNVMMGMHTVLSL